MPGSLFEFSPLSLLAAFSLDILLAGLRPWGESSVEDRTRLGEGAKASEWYDCAGDTILGIFIAPRAVGEFMVASLAVLQLRFDIFAGVRV